MTKETYNKINQVLGPTWLPNMLWSSQLPVIRHLLYMWLPLLTCIISITITAIICGLLQVFGIIHNAEFTINFLAVVEFMACTVLFYKKGKNIVDNIHTKLQNFYDKVKA